MATRKNTRRDCPVCGTKNAMVLEARNVPVRYKEHQREHLVTTWWCTKCGEGILEPEMLAENERRFVELRAQVDNVLLPEQVRAIRERLGISQREAGKLLGGGVRAFQKYESGEVPVSSAMKHLLVLLGNEPARLQEIADTGAKAMRDALPRRAPRTPQPLKRKSAGKASPAQRASRAQPRAN